MLGVNKVRIDGPNRAEIDGPGGGQGAASQPTRSSDARNAAAAGEASIGEVSCRPYIRQALACEEVDLQAIAEAKVLLESGQLDTPAAAARAAERILSMGI